MEYKYKIEINKTFINVLITESGNIRIELHGNMNDSHQSPFFVRPENGQSQWIALLTRQRRWIHLHLKMVDNIIQCNLGRELEPDNNQYPFFFMTKLRYLAIRKKAKQIEEEYQRDYSYF